MSRVFFCDMGIEKAFLESYEDSGETGEGVQFYDCIFSDDSLSAFDGLILHLNYSTCELEVYDNDGGLMAVRPIKLVACY